MVLTLRYARDLFNNNHIIYHLKVAESTMRSIHLSRLSFNFIYHVVVLLTIKKNIEAQTPKACQKDKHTQVIKDTIQFNS